MEKEQMGVKVKKGHRKIIWLFTVFFFICGSRMRVQAAEAKVYFGSGEYEAEEGETFRIGFYLEADREGFLYEASVQYDPNKLEYLGGADGEIDGMLYFAGECAQTQRRYMMSFRALEEGVSSISAVNANVVACETQAEGGEAMPSIPMEMGISEMAVSPVKIIKNQQEPLITAIEIAELPEFEWKIETYMYQLTVPYETDQLHIAVQTRPEQADVDISETMLSEGDNTVTIAVGSGEARAEYVLEVVREAFVVPVAESESVQETETEERRKSVEAQGETGMILIPEETAVAVTEPEKTHFDLRKMMRTVFLTGLVILLSALSSLIIYVVRKHRKVKTEDDAAFEEEWLDDGLEYEQIEFKDDEEWKQWMELVDEETGEAEEDMKKVDKEGEEKEVREEKEEPVIRVKDVSMRFKISEANATSLKEYALLTLKRQNKYHELIALDHVSFEVQKGEVVGIIGTNGSGKSTLLKLIAGAMNPTEGRIEVDRKGVQLLTLGTGFDGELTARENVYLNGAIIGYSKAFIDENYDAIVEFAELDGFMDEKIKNFSSGMVSRLGFAIATVGKAPEVLILDEVLSVGDMFFRRKSGKRIKELIHGGSTVLIVSHSTESIIKNCTKAVWIEKGVLKEIGEPKAVCTAYQKMVG